MRSSCIERVRAAGRSKQERRDEVQEVMSSRSFGPWKSIKDFDFDFIFLGSKITIDGNCIHQKKKKKKFFLIGGKAMKNPNSILKNRDTTFITKVI